MRKSSFISVLVALLVVAAVVVWHFVPRQLPYSECSDIYKHYAAEKGIEATYIKDYKVNDTVFVDVTLLEATDSVGWNKLCKDFYIPELDSFSQSRIDGGKDLIFTKLINKKDIPQLIEKNYSGNIIRSVSFIKKTICIFYIKNEDEEHAVLYYNFDKSIKKGSKYE